MVCTLHSHQIGFNKIIDRLKNSIPKGHIKSSERDGFKIVEIKTKGGLLAADSILEISYRERLKPDYKISENQVCPLNENLKGLYGYVSALPIKNENVKKLFLHKIQTVNSEFSIFQVKGKTKNLKTVIGELSQTFDAISFVQPKTIIAKAAGQHFLDKDLNLISDTQGNCKIEDLKVAIDAIYYDAPPKDLTEDQKTRKANSENRLKKHNIKINKIFPL